MALDKDMIREPQMWQLVMEIDSTALHVMAFSMIENHSLISADLPLDKGQTPLKAFQEAVYENPLLLADVSRVTILLPSRRFMLMPDMLLDSGESLDAFRRAFPAGSAESREEILVEEMPGMNCGMLTAIPADMLGFMRRTFNNPRISHPLTPLALYFKAKHPTRPRGKMLVNLRADRCDVVILGEAAPLVLNSFPIHDPMDAVYYIMACREGIGLRPTDEIILAGEPVMRQRVSPVLRRFVRYVMPAIFPSVMFRAGKASLRTPFEMVVAPLLQPC